MAQVSLMRELGIDHPRTWAFNDVPALRKRGSELSFPALIKGCGAAALRIDFAIATAMRLTALVPHQNGCDA